MSEGEAQAPAEALLLTRFVDHKVRATRKADFLAENNSFNYQYRQLRATMLDRSRPATSGVAGRAGKATPYCL